MISKLEKALLKTNANSQFVTKSDSRVIELEQELDNMVEPFLLSGRELDSKKIIHPKMKNQAILKHFADVSFQISQKSESLSGQMILVTSIVPKSGVSYVARNLAAAVALDSTRSSLLLDCHFSEPSQHSVFKLKGKKGVGDFISNDNTELSKLIHNVGIPKVRCMPAGGAKVSDGIYFKHPRMKLMLNHLRQRYSNRDVVIDAPPLLEDFGSKMLLDYCDHVVLVVPYGKVSEEMLHNAYAMIGADKMAGVVFNQR